MSGPKIGDAFPEGVVFSYATFPEWTFAVVTLADPTYLP